MDLLRFQQIGTGPGSQTGSVVNQRYDPIRKSPVQDNQTLVIGGLIRNNSSLNLTKIPLLSDIPLDRAVLRDRREGDASDRTELMIFLTPHVVNTAKRQRAMTFRRVQEYPARYRIWRGTATQPETA